MGDVGDLPVFSMEEVAKHNDAKSCWFVVDGLVYDSTKYNDTHPGGASSILLNAGEDASEEFNSIHSAKAKGLLKDWLIGKLAGAAVAEPVAPATPPLASLTTLEKKGKVRLPLAEKTQISPDTVILRFSLPSPEHTLGLPCGQHFFVYAKDAAGKLVIRAYTPITADNVKGYVDLLIKVYRPSQDFPEGGIMSQVMDKLAIGDSIEVKGPIGHFHYLGRGKYTKDNAPGTCTCLSMIAGGTGITPMWQIASQILADPEDKTQVKLLFANRNEEDILLCKELDGHAQKHSNFTVHYTLSGRTPAEWKYSTGRINEAMLREHVFPASDTTLALLCGPQGMIDVAAKPNLTKMGYKDSTFVEF
jgi:nitrate reductase (NAD(P)H)